MIRIRTIFSAMIIISVIALNNAQAPSGCTCVTNLCASIEAYFNALQFAMETLISTYQELMRYAQQYPEYVSAAQVALTTAQEAVRNAFSSIELQINTCKSDTCCDYCCQSKYGEVNNIYNASYLESPNISVGRAKPMLCQGVATSQNITKT